MRSLWDALTAEAEARARRLRAAAPSTGGVLIACSAVPPEIFERRGLRTFRLAAPGSALCESRGEAAVGHEACSWCKGLAGGPLEGEVRAALLVCSTGCDQMKRALEVVARRCGVRFEAVNVPSTRTLHTLSLYEYELERLDALAAGLPEGYEAGLVDYSRSGDRDGDYSTSVSYASILMTSGQEQEHGH